MFFGSCAEEFSRFPFTGQSHSSSYLRFKSTSRNVIGKLIPGEILNFLAKRHTLFGGRWKKVMNNDKGLITVYTISTGTIEQCDLYYSVKNAKTFFQI